MQQKLDKVAIGVSVLLIILGIAWTFVAEDTGGGLSAQITEYANDIDETRREQNSLDLGSPPDVEGDVRGHFLVVSPGEFPAWSFYRRPATYSVKTVRVEKPASLTAGAICQVESLRAQPARSFQRVQGVRAVPENATIESQVVQMRAAGETEWRDLSVIGAGDPGSSFELDVEEGLEPGISYEYRVVTTAKSNGLDFPGSGPQKSVESTPSEALLFPVDRAWEIPFIQAGGLGQSPTVTVKLYYWDWDKMKVQQKQAFHQEKDGKKLFDTDYVVDLVRMDLNPPAVKLKGPQRGDILTIERGVKPSSLDPGSWESEDPACTGESEDAPGDSVNGSTQETSTPVETTTPPPSDDDDDDDDSGGLFGGDD